MQGQSQGQGLSPRMRGNLHNRNAVGPAVGSIPAYAGEPKGVGRLAGQLKVYPRVCGGTDSAMSAMPQRKGLSPRMRGNLLWHSNLWRAGGSIPAYAGEPPAWSWMALAREVYPRVCGGTGPPERR